MLNIHSIKTRLLTGFTFMLLIIVILSGISLYHIARLSALSSALYEHPLVISNTVRDVTLNILKIHRNMKDILFASDQRLVAKALQEIDRYEEQTAKHFDLITKRFLGDRERVEELRTTFEQWAPLREELIHLIAQGQQAEAIQLNQKHGDQYVALLERQAKTLTDFARDKSESFLMTAQGEHSSAYWLTLATLVIAIITGLAISSVTSKTITRPLQTAIDVSEQISQGDLNVSFKKIPNDEVGQVLRAMERMVAYLQDVATVSEKIAAQDLDIEVQPKTPSDILNTSLQRMVANLQTMMDDIQRSMTEIEEQNWLKSGQAELSNLMRGEQELPNLARTIITYLATYLHAQTGVLYLYSDEEQTLRLIGSYAYTKRKSSHNTVRIGEGLVGQAVLEKQPILYSDIPDDYLWIASGLGKTTPRYLLVCPFSFGDEVKGVVELAKTQEFREIELSFLDQATESIAVAFNSNQIRLRIQHLLEESQQATTLAEEAKELSQEKAKEVQEANVRLEEQQQKLQQQSEELQQVNTHLEEQQQQIQQQTEELRQQNESLKTTKEELAQQAHKLENASQYKSDFLANMSHELRTPLNSIILLSKALSRNEQQHFNENEVKQAEVIHQAGQELLRLINDILDLSKIEAGKMSLNMSEVSTQEFLAGFKDLFSSLAREKHIQFRIHDVANCQIRTDSDKLAQIIRNLLANAFKFTRDGSVTLTTALLPPSHETFEITVQDTGIGIPEDKQAMIFEAFHQGDSSTSREFGGTGLGLSIVREYTALLHGEIALESEPEEGTCFRLTFPKILKDPPSAAPPDPSSHSANQPLSSARLVDDRKYVSSSDTSILLIEDDITFASLMMDIIRDMGFKILIAQTGQDGLSLAAQFLPTGILLDLGLPDINGMEVLRELKRTKELRHIPVHIISGQDQDQLSRQIGAIGHAQKPVNTQDIQNALQQILAVSEKSSKHVLLVEDDPIQRDAIRSLLTTPHITVTETATQHEAFDRLISESYDATIIDLNLHDGNGYAICQYIKEHRPDLPVIIYTAQDLTQEQERRLRQYTDSIIIKTIRSHERLSEEIALFLHQIHQQHVPQAHPSSLSSKTSLQGQRIMIVDDDIKNVFVLASIFEKKGAIVIDAPNGKEALEKIRQKPVDLVLMDIMMPVMDGYEAIRQIREDPQLCHLPVIALTAKALKGDREACIQAGADDYISKPVDYDTLLQVAQAWIDQRHS